MTAAVGRWVPPPEAMVVGARCMRRSRGPPLSTALSTLVDVGKGIAPSREGFHLGSAARKGDGEVNEVTRPAGAREERPAGPEWDRTASAC